MKYLGRQIIAFILGLFASLVIRKYHPTIVMVTGSVGKTSTKDALAAVLKSSFFVRASEKSYNSEFGVPFTIFGVKNPWHSVGRWLEVFKEATALILLPNHYPNLLILEVGADRPGDLERIVEIATPNVVVVTRLPEIPVHVEAYASPEAVREEEFFPAYMLDSEAPLIYASDDPYAGKMVKRTSASLHTFGYAPADVRLGVPTFYSEEGKIVGMQANVTTRTNTDVIIVRGSVGDQQLLPAAAALATALALSIPFERALGALSSYVPPPGRCRLFAGAHDTIIIDDSYNSSPAAVEEALKTLERFPRARRVAILGDMLELGRYSVIEHKRMGVLAHKAADLIISVGVRARTLEATHAYDNAYSAAVALKEIVKPGDVILVKGSQSMRMERIVAALLKNPDDTNQLVRQEKEWLQCA